MKYLKYNKKWDLRIIFIDANRLLFVYFLKLAFEKYIYLIYLDYDV